LSEERGREEFARAREQTLERAVTIAAGALRASGATALLLSDGDDPHPAALVRVGADAADADHPLRWREVAERGGPVRIPPTEGGSAWLGVPIRAAGTGMVGVLSVTGSPDGGWGEADADLLARIAAGAAAELGLRAELDASGAAALRERERQLNEAQALARVGSWEWNLVTGRGSWSDEHYRLFGYEPGSVAVSFAVVAAHVHPDDRDAFHDAVRKAAAGEQALDRVVRVVRPDGEMPCLHLRGELEVDAAGTPVRLFGTAQDVTELERVSRALRESEERYRRMVEAAGDIIYEADVEGRFTYANPATLRILGYETGEVIGRRYTALMRADYHAVAAEFYARQVRERLATTYFEFPAVTRGGSEVWIGQIVQLVWAGDGVAGWHAVARDISAQREVDRLKSEFVAVVSHELRTPLTSIRGSLGLLASGKAGALTDRGQRLVQIAVQNADRLVRLINDILDIERLESGLVSLARRRVTAASLVDAALATVGGLSEAAAVRIDVSPLPPDAALCADPDRLVQVLTNLLSNAVKFSPRGTTVRLCVRRTEAGTEFRVEDQGRGIPPEELESVFIRFHQVDSSDSRDKGGTGLGLAISRSIVEHHGGRMWVESELGRGSTFSFVIPPDDAACAGAADEAQAGLPA
jgi:PAS domain S-box-containing protein